jgi:hypothetical protein
MNETARLTLTLSAAAMLALLSQGVVAAKQAPAPGAAPAASLAPIDPQQAERAQQALARDGEKMTAAKAKLAADRRATMEAKAELEKAVQANDRNAMRQARMRLRQNRTVQAGDRKAMIEARTLVRNDRALAPRGKHAPKGPHARKISADDEPS